MFQGWVQRTWSASGEVGAYGLVQHHRLGAELVGEKGDLGRSRPAHRVVRMGEPLLRQCVSFYVDN